MADDYGPIDQPRLKRRARFYAGQAHAAPDITSAHRMVTPCCVQACCSWVLLVQSSGIGCMEGRCMQPCRGEAKTQSKPSQ